MKISLGKLKKIIKEEAEKLSNVALQDFSPESYLLTIEEFVEQHLTDQDQGKLQLDQRTSKMLEMVAALVRRYKKENNVKISNELTEEELKHRSQTIEELKKTAKDV